MERDLDEEQPEQDDFDDEDLVDEYEEQERSASQRLATASDDVTALLDRAEARTSLMRLEEAKEDLDRALALAPEAPLVYLALARFRIEVNDRAGARIAAERALACGAGADGGAAPPAAGEAEAEFEEHPRAWGPSAACQTHTLLSQLLLEEGDRARARQHAEDALVACGHSADAWIAKARVQVQSEEPEAALSTLARAAEICTENPDPLIVMSRLQRSRGRHDEALEGLAGALERHPADAGLRAEYAELLLARGDAREALAEIEQVFEQLGDDAMEDYELLCIRAEASFAVAVTLRERALEDYENAAAAAPEEVDAHLGLAEVSLDEGDHERAARALDSALEADPESAQAYFMKSCVGWPPAEEAIACLGEAIRLAPNMAEAYLHRACLLLELEDRAAAEADIEKARALGIAEREIDDVLEEGRRRKLF